MDEKKKNEPESGRRGLDPGPNVPDPSPLDGQIGEGATVASGEPIARMVRTISEQNEPDDTPEN